MYNILHILVNLFLDLSITVQYSNKSYFVTFRSITVE